MRPPPGAERRPPPAPTSLRETARTADGFTIAWDAPGDTEPAISHYDVQYRTPPTTGTWTDGPQDVAAAATTATLSGLTAGTEYAVQVRAVNTDGDGAWSQPVTATAGPPRITAVAISSDAGADDTYLTGDTIEVTVTFDTAVEVTGTPVLALAVGTGSRDAEYASGGGTEALVFAYTVASTDGDDADGIAIGAAALSLPDAATIASGVAANLAHAAVAADAAHRVDTTRPRLLSAATSTDGATVTLTFSEAIRSDPTPRDGVVVRMGAELVGLSDDAWVVAGRTVTVTLDTPVLAGRTVRVEVQDLGDFDFLRVIRDLVGRIAIPRTVTATNNAAVRAALVLTPETIAENGGVSTVTATLSGASDAVTALTVSVTPVSPATAADFTLSADPVLTIAASQTTSTGTVTITAVDNAVAAADKTFTVGAAIVNEDGVPAPADVTLTIRNDDGGICARTLAVQTGILALLPAVSGCGNVTDTHLAGITGSLDLSSQGISSLKAGDFAGLSALEVLHLDRNALTTLPSGLLPGLSSLDKLYLARNALTALPADLISGLSSLTNLWLEHNELTRFPPGFFSGQGDFSDLHLDHNPGDPDLERWTACAPRSWARPPRRTGHR